MNTLVQNIKQDYDTKYEQVDASVRFVLHDKPEFYESLRYLPKRVEAAILTMVMDWMEPVGYHFAILRAAARQYNRGSGFISEDEAPFTLDELQ